LASTGSTSPAGLIGLRQAMPKPLFWIAPVAGIGLFALRLSSEGCWTAISSICCRRGEAGDA
jgi:hypothetical protein